MINCQATRDGRQRPRCPDASSHEPGHRPRAVRGHGDRRDRRLLFALSLAEGPRAGMGARAGGRLPGAVRLASRASSDRGGAGVRRLRWRIRRHRDRVAMAGGRRAPDRVGHWRLTRRGPGHGDDHAGAAVLREREPRALARS